MLVLTRRLGQGIAIGGSIEVRVLELGAGQVRLGITAPEDVKVLRDELIGREHAGPSDARGDGAGQSPRENGHAGGR